jgi:hypothetical protein
MSGVLRAAAWDLLSFCIRFFRAERGKTVYNEHEVYRSVEGSIRQLPLFPDVFCVLYRTVRTFAYSSKFFSFLVMFCAPRKTSPRKKKSTLLPQANKPVSESLNSIKKKRQRSWLLQYPDTSNENPSIVVLVWRRHR